MRGSSITILSFVALAAVSAGCQSSQMVSPPRPLGRAAEAPKAVDITGRMEAASSSAVAEEENSEAPGAATAERKPYRVGDFVVYPLKDRNPEETAYRLYVLLYPKYGQYLQVVPDPHTNALLIFLPPAALRAQGKVDS